jgi:hypothetical protein
MTDFTLTLVVSFTVAAFIILVFSLFVIVNNFNQKIMSLEHNIENRSYDSVVQTVSKTAYETKDRLDALTAHLNVDVKQEPQKYVVKERK